MGVPLPKGQRGLLVSAAVVGARSQVEVEQVSGMLTLTSMVVSRHSLSCTRVCCAAWHHTPLPCRWKKRGLWCVESNRREGGRGD